MEKQSYEIGRPNKEESPGAPLVQKDVNPPEKNCMNCIFMTQGYGNAFCCNPNQTDEGYKSYIYWCFSCPLFCEGNSRGNDQFMINLGYEKDYHQITLYDGREGGFYYWKLKTTL